MMNDGYQAKTSVPKNPPPKGGATNAMGLQRKNIMNDAYQPSIDKPMNNPPFGGGNAIPPTQKIIIEVRHLGHE